MPVNPDDIDLIAARQVEVYKEAELAILGIVRDHLSRGIDAPTWTQDRLAGLGSLRRATLRVLAKLRADRGGRFRAAVSEAYRNGRGSVLTDLGGVTGAAAREAVKTVPRLDAIESLSAALIRDVGQRELNVLRHVQDVYREVQAAAVARSIAGGITRREASQAAWQGFVDQGVTSFTDVRGRTWKLSTYVEMAVRTVTMRAAVQGQLDRLEQLGIPLVIVSNESQECPRCRPYEGKVLAATGPFGALEVKSITTGQMITVDVMTTLDIARLAGLMHPNCRHTIRAYLPGATRLPAGPTEQPEEHKARERQREIERKIRKHKEQAEAALTPDAKKDADAKVRAWQAEMRQHIKDNPTLKRLPYREEIGAGNIPPGGKAPSAAGRLTGPPPPKPAPPAPKVPEKATPTKAAKKAAPVKKAAKTAPPPPTKKPAAKATAASVAEPASPWGWSQGDLGQINRDKAAREAQQSAELDRQAEVLATKTPKTVRTGKAALATPPVDLAKLTAAGDPRADALWYRIGLTDGGYVEQAGYLRNGGSGNPRLDAIIADTDSLMRESKLPAPILVYRGLTDGGPILGGDGDATGRTFTDAGYASTTTDPRQAVRWGQTQLRITVPAGVHAVRLADRTGPDVSHLEADQSEILLDRGLTYRVVRDRRVGDQRIVDVEVVPVGSKPAKAVPKKTTAKKAVEKTAPPPPKKPKATKAAAPVKKATPVKAAKKKTAPPKTTPPPPKKATPAVKAARPAGVTAAELHAELLAERLPGTRIRDELVRQAGLTPRAMRQLDAMHLPEPGTPDGDAFLAMKHGSALAYYTPLGSHPSVYATEAATSDHPAPAIWLSPAWHGGTAGDRKRKGNASGWFSPSGAETPIAQTTAHEYGHHVSQVFFEEPNFNGTADMPGEIALRLLGPMNDALGGNRHHTIARNGDLLEPVHHGFRDNLHFSASGDLLDTYVQQNKDLITRMVSGYAATNFSEMMAEIWQEYSTRGAAARPHIKVIGELMRQIAEEVRT